VSLPPLAADARWARVQRLVDEARLDAAAQLLDALRRERAADADLLVAAATLAHRRGDMAGAIDALQAARTARPDDGSIGVDLGVALTNAGRLDEAEAALDAALAVDGGHAIGWLVLGRLREVRGAFDAAHGAWTRAVGIAQRAGEWTSDANTPPEWRTLVRHAAAQVRRHRRAVYVGAYEALRAVHGDAALARVDHAVRVHLREVADGPRDAMQKPRFLYFPGLPQTPFMDPFLQPWARRLADAFETIRDDALRVVREDAHTLPDFIVPPDGAPRDAFVGGDAADPRWQAFFFWRHGERFDANHARCPRTSEVLESLELCRIAGEAPEILFSVLRPGSYIKPHHGVTNVRAVMHLPLVVPPDCALRLVDRGEHAWREGELVLFDDTYLHEAWNRSDRTRIVLLMDCWNPHLTAVEKQALVLLIEAIGGLHRRAGTTPAGAPARVLAE
jgi:aspartate beta-hydroxylase